MNWKAFWRKKQPYQTPASLQIQQTQQIATQLATNSALQQQVINQILAYPPPLNGAQIPTLQPAQPKASSIDDLKAAYEKAKQAYEEALVKELAGLNDQEGSDKQ